MIPNVSDLFWHFLIIFFFFYSADFHDLASRLAFFLLLPFFIFHIHFQFIRILFYSYSSVPFSIIFTLLSCIMNNLLIILSLVHLFFEFHHSIFRETSFVKFLFHIILNFFIPFTPFFFFKFPFS